MYNLSVNFERVLILTLVSCYNKILLERGYILYSGSYCGSLRGAWRITGSSGLDNHACLSSNVYEVCVLVSGGYLFDYLLVMSELLGILLVGTGVDWYFIC